MTVLRYALNTERIKTMSKVSAISIQVQKHDRAIIEELTANKDMSVTKLETSSFDGQSEIVTLVITVTPMVLTFLGKILIEQIRARKYVKVVYKGVQIQGINESTVADILAKIIGEGNE
jgi:hypothetical protein